MELKVQDELVYDKDIPRNKYRVEVNYVWENGQFKEQTYYFDTEEIACRFIEYIESCINQDSSRFLDALWTGTDPTIFRDNYSGINYDYIRIMYGVRADDIPLTYKSNIFVQFVKEHRKEFSKCNVGYKSLSEPLGEPFEITRVTYYDESGLQHKVIIE